MKSIISTIPSGKKRETPLAQAIDDYEDDCISGEFIRIRDYHKKDSSVVRIMYPVMVE